MEELTEEMEGLEMRRKSKVSEKPSKMSKLFNRVTREKSQKQHDFQSGHNFVTCQQRKLFYFRSQTIDIILLTYLMCFNSEHPPQLLYLIFSKYVYSYNLTQRTTVLGQYRIRNENMVLKVKKTEV